jgi:hypothetical protein
MISWFGRPLGQYGVEGNEPFVVIEVMSAEHYAKA